MGNVACCAQNDASRGKVDAKKPGHKGTMDNKPEEAQKKRQSVIMKASGHH